MTRRFRLPIRLKILAGLLLVVTGVVSAITFTMANFFHDDKQAYLHDLSSVVALSTAKECRAALVGYTERLRVYSRIIDDETLAVRQKSTLLEGFFDDFPELVSVELRRGDEQLGAAYNSAALDAAGVTREQLREDSESRRVDRDPGQVYLGNSTLAAALPTFTLIERLEAVGQREPLVLTAVIRLDYLMDLTGRSNGFDVLLLDSDRVLLAAADVQRVARRERRPLDPQVEQVLGGRGSSLTLEYDDDGVAMIGGFADAEFAGIVVAAQIPRSVANLAARGLLDTLLLVAIGLLVLATLLGMFWAYRLTRPVEQLSTAARSIAKGEFGIRVAVDSGDEIGTLAESFNQMGAELAERDDKLQEAHAQLIQSEKLAAFGQLGAGIAHEVKNPLAGILGCAQLCLRKVERETPVHRNLVLIEKETKRCKAIIENLLKFARQEKAVMEPVRIEQVIEDSVAIVHHQLDLHKVKLDQEFEDDLPQIHGNANQLQQVFMNLMINAQQAMDGKPGNIRLEARRLDDQQIEIAIRDDGPGMTDEVRSRLFEPFFTTKPGGKGTGLGLSVSFGIVRDHQGTIAVDSAPGQGTTFRIALPAVEENPSTATEANAPATVSA